LEPIAVETEVHVHDIDEAVEGPNTPIAGRGNRHCVVEVGSDPLGISIDGLTTDGVVAPTPPDPRLGVHDDVDVVIDPEVVSVDVHEG
jgi:hypothetical protein